MKKVFLAFTAIILSVVCVNAQKSSSMSSHPTTFSVGVDAAFPMGDARSAGYKFGIGGTAAAEHNVSTNVGLSLSAGYISFSNGGTGNSRAHFNTIPVLGGVKYWFVPKFYAMGQLGAAFNNVSTPLTSVTKTTTEFAYTLGVGTSITKNIGLGVKYFSDDTFNWVNVCLAYKFGGK